MDELATFIAGLPKAELHVHIEGTLEPELMFALAARNGIGLPYASEQELRSAYDFDSLQDFLDLYYRGVEVLITARDFYDLAWAYLERASGDPVLHTEIFFDPQAHRRRGVAFSTVLDGLRQAQAEAKARLGISSRLIACFLRDLPLEDALACFEEIRKHPEDIVGVGLDSAELGHPPEKFEALFARAREAGFLAVAHAGEEGPPDYVRQALNALGAARIDHGVRAIEDDALVRRLAETGVPLTVCPLSNLKLKVVEDMSAHPLRQLMRRGVRVTLNSDDPAYFGGYINRNFLAAAEALALSQAELATLARNSFEASFLTEADKHTLLTRLDRYLAGQKTEGET